MSPPLIVHVIYSLSTGGLENGLVNILNRLPPGEFRHVIVCITTADEFAARITASGVEVIQLHKAQGHDLRFYARLWRLFRQLSPQIIHSRNLAALETQLLSLGMPGVRRVHGEHGREVGDIDGGNRRYLAFRRFMRRFIHHYIAVSRDLESWLTERVGVPPEKVTQIYNGVDHECFHPGNVKPLALLPASWRGRDDILVVGTVGRLTPVKDQQLLLRAAAALRVEEPALGERLRVLFVGDGPLLKDLQRLAAQLGLTPVVWFAGARRDVPELLHLMDVFVLPSLGEGLSNTVLEAMSSGLPVIATAVGGNVELVRDGVNGTLFPVGDSGALSRALADLLRDAATRSNRGSAALRTVQQRFDWSNTVAAYRAVYEELLQGHSAAAPNFKG